MCRTTRKLFLCVCGQLWHRSACASVQSDKGLDCRLKDNFDTIEYIGKQQRPCSAGPLLLANVFYSFYTVTKDAFTDYLVQIRIARGTDGATILSQKRTAKRISACINTHRRLWCSLHTNSYHCQGNNCYDQTVRMHNLEWTFAVRPVFSLRVCQFN